MARNDHAYTEMLNMMREQGAKDNPVTLQVGIMESSNSVRIDDLVLEHDDLYIAHNLFGGLYKGDTVVVQKVHEKEMYVILAKVVEA